MSLERIIDEWVGVMGEEQFVRSLKEAKKLSKRVKMICESLRTIEEVDSSTARYTLEQIKNIDAEPPLVEKTTFRNKILIQRELRSARNVLFNKKYLGGIMDKNWEAFMDADAQIVCVDLGIPTPIHEDIPSFKINMKGKPIPENWDFLLELTGERRRNIDLGQFEYEGVAKLGQSLLYVDWIHTSKKKSDFTLGPPFILRPPKTIPLPLVDDLYVPGKRGHDFDLLISTPTDIDAEMKKKHCSYLDIHSPKEKELRSYNPLPSFVFSAKIETLKGDGEDDLETLRERVINGIRQNIPESPADIGWKLGVFISIYKKIEFPSMNRGKLIQQGKETSTQPLASFTPISKEEYRQCVLDKFEEDGVYHSEHTSSALPFLWGAVQYRVLGSFHVFPIPYGFGVGASKSDDFYVFCVGFLGISDRIDQDLFKEFDKSAKKFAQNISPSNHKLEYYPVLMTDSLDLETKKWAETIRRGAIVELSRGRIHFMRESYWGTQATAPFFMRYFLTDEMRSVVNEGYVEPRVSTKCQNCGTTYSYEVIEIESGSAKCQNCGKQIDTEAVTIFQKKENGSV